MTQLSYDITVVLGHLAFVFRDTGGDNVNWNGSSGTRTLSRPSVTLARTIEFKGRNKVSVSEPAERSN